MNSNESLLNSIFFPRPSFKDKDTNDQLVEVEDNIYVSVRSFLKDQMFPTILFFHGNAELSSEYDEIASCYHECGLNFIVADYRGYGLSTGSPNRTNLHTDSIHIFKYINSFLSENGYNNKKMIMGRSLGSASAAEIISKHEDEIDGCIIESGFATELPLLETLGIDPKDINYRTQDGFGNHAKFSNFRGPLFIIHAKEDHIIPLNEAELIYNDSVSDNKELWLVNHANHNDILIHTAKDYFRRIKLFIDSI